MLVKKEKLDVAMSEAETARKALEDKQEMLRLADAMVLRIQQ